MVVSASPFPDVEIPDVPLTAYVLERAERHPDRIAIVDGPTGRADSYAALREAIGRCAGGLLARGVTRGDSWGSWRRTCPSTRWRSTARRPPVGWSRASTPPTAPRRCATSSSTPGPASW